MRDHSGGVASPQQNSERFVLVALLLGLASIIGAVFVFQPRLLPVADSKPESKARGNFGRTATPFVWPGIDRPPTVSAADAKLPADADVIGVTVGSRHRAYSVAAFNGVYHHIVNDVLADEPVSVTYCDQDGCVQVFTDPTKGQPLKIWLGGWSEGLLLKVGHVFYYQRDLKSMDPRETFPYPTRAFERTTWGKWRAKYPDTDVYVDIEPAAETKSIADTMKK